MRRQNNFKGFENGFLPESENSNSRRRGENKTNKKRGKESRTAKKFDRSLLALGEDDNNNKV